MIRLRDRYGLARGPLPRLCASGRLRSMTNPQPIEIPPPSPDDVLYEKRENFAVITLNRPVVLTGMALWMKKQART